MRVINIRGAILLAICVTSIAGCNRRVIPEASAEVATVLGGASVAPAGPYSAKVWADVKAFYAKRQGDPAWINKLKMSTGAVSALEVIRNAPEHGLIAADYDESKLTQLFAALAQGKEKAPDRLQQLADADVRLTTALLTLGRDVAIGRSTPEPLSPQWKARRKAPDFSDTLSSVIDGGDGNISGWLTSMAPQHPEYAALKKALADLRATAMAKPGTALTTFYDTTKPDGIKAFQEHHGLKVSGTLDPATKAAIAVPIEERVHQIEVNLERWRWMPDDFGKRHFMVNIPLYHVFAREDGKVVKDIRVVVGKPGNNTPIFSELMTTVVFSPYWNIPDSIVEGETAPAMAKNPEYLAKNRIEILRVGASGSSKVDPSEVDWDDPAELKQLAFRQLPGPSNALGHVKFLFPNVYNVYLHDSPADDLFGRTGRAFSHGCVRVEEPETLAKYVLRDDPAWTDEKFFAAMNSGTEQHVALKEKIPVHIVYFTTWVDANNGLHFQPDIYGYDAKQLAARR